MLFWFIIFIFIKLNRKCFYFFKQFNFFFANINLLSFSTDDLLFTIHTIQGREAVSAVIAITIVIPINIILLTILILAKGLGILLVYTGGTIDLSTSAVPDVSASLGKG